jgi:hypothetical protein
MIYEPDCVFFNVLGEAGDLLDAYLGIYTIIIIIIITKNKKKKKTYFKI